MPNTAFLPSIIGLSWFAVLSTMSLPSWCTSQTQPLPKRVAPPLFICSLNTSNEPNAPRMASAMKPVGSPPLPGAMISQNIVWFT